MHPLYEKAASLTDEVVKAAVRVRDHFGIGALESIYVRCLEQELKLAGHETSREQGIKIAYRGMTFDENLRYDLLVDDCLLVEAKACEKENKEQMMLKLRSNRDLMMGGLNRRSLRDTQSCDLLRCLRPRRCAAGRQREQIAVSVCGATSYATASDSFAVRAERGAKAKESLAIPRMGEAHLR